MSGNPTGEKTELPTPKKLRDARKKGQGVAKSELLVINKTDLAPHVGVSLEEMERDTTAARAGRPFVMAQMRHGRGVDQVVAFLTEAGGLSAAMADA